MISDIGSENKDCTISNTSASVAPRLPGLNTNPIGAA